MKENIAVVGCGHWGKNFVRIFHDMKILAAICDVDKNRLDSFKDKNASYQVYNNYAQLLNDKRVDAVVISTPAATHYSLAKEALLADKDILVEKPIALYYEEGEKLLSLARERNKILMIGHILIYHPAITELKRMIDAGELGKINYIYSSRLNLGKFRTEENILWSFAPHDISVILYLLNELPTSISTSGGNYLNTSVTDVTVTNLSFSSGVKSHIFVSWLHPYKEQRLVIIGEKKMALFNDVNPKDKLFVYDHKIDWIERAPVPRPEEARPIKIETKEPLWVECEHFLECIQSRKTPLTDGNEALQVLKILEACQNSLGEKGKTVEISEKRDRKFFLHHTSYIDESCEIGEGTKIWHFSHILDNCVIGKNCVIGQNVSIGPNVSIGNNVKIQNNVSVYEGVTLEDDVFCGPSMVFTNVINPRSHWPRRNEFKKTLVKKGATLGANSTILCGVTIGQYAFVGAGAFANKDVPDYAIVYGVPGRIQGWICYCGVKLSLSNSDSTNETAECANCGRKYKKDGNKAFEVIGRGKH